MRPRCSSFLSTSHNRGLPPSAPRGFLGCWLGHQLSQSLILMKATEGLGFDLAGPPAGNTSHSELLLVVRELDLRHGRVRATSARGWVLAAMFWRWDDHDRTVAVMGGGGTDRAHQHPSEPAEATRSDDKKAGLA